MIGKRAAYCLCALLFFGVCFVFAEPKITQFPLQLQPTESLVDLKGSQTGFIAVIKSQVAGIVPKTEFWIQTTDGRLGPFNEVLYTLAVTGTDWRNYCAIVRLEDNYYLAYGAPQAGSMLPELATFGNRWSPHDYAPGTHTAREDSVGYGSILISFDQSRFAAVVQSKAHKGAFDIVTEKGILDWYTEPLLVGFENGRLLYWTMKAEAGTGRYVLSLFDDRELVFKYSASDYYVKNEGPDGCLSFKQFKYLDFVYISPDEKTWGYYADSDVDTKLTTFVVRTPDGKSTNVNAGRIGRSNIIAIMPDGHIVSDRFNLRIDGKEMGVSSKYVFASPNGSRVAIFMSSGEFLIDGQIVQAIPKFEWNLRDYKPFVQFSVDSKHYAVSWKLQRDDADLLNIDGIWGIRQFHFNPIVLNDWKNVLSSENGSYYINTSVIPGISASKNNYVANSPDASEVYFTGNWIYSNGEVYSGSPFGPIAYPNGSVTYKDGAVVIKYWPSEVDAE